MKAIQVMDNTHLVPVRNGRAIMVGAPPEALKVLVLWEFPFPDVVVVPPDPLYANGINQASFEFLLYNYLFRMDGLRDRKPFLVICDPAQKARIESLARQMLRGPSDEEMAEFRTLPTQRRQLLLETTVVSGEVSKLRLDQMVRVVPFVDGRVELPDGVILESLPSAELRITYAKEVVCVPRRAQGRATLPFYFADVETPVVGPRFGLQVIGSASGFSGAEWGSCFIIWINGQPLIVDGTPYLDDHLRRLGIEDDHILGYLITHNHEDHANAFGQLVSRRPVTVLTSGPVMAGLVTRLAGVLNCPQEEVRKLFRWIPLHPGLEEFGEPLYWFGAEIRTWYSVHTVPTLGLDISMEGKHIRMPGDTLWGRQLEPLLEQRVLSPERYDFIQHTYDNADVIVADAGGGPVHPDPQEVHELVEHGHGCQIMVTHIPEFARKFLPTADPGTSVTLVPRAERTPEEAMGLFGSPVLRKIPERWLLALIYGGEVSIPPEEPIDYPGGAICVLAGGLSLLDAELAGEPEGEAEQFLLQRGDLFHPSLAPGIRRPALVSTAKWTRVLHIPEALYLAFVEDTGIKRSLERLYRTRVWWRPITGEELGLDTIVALAQLSRERRFEAGAPIVRQGDPATHFYIVTEGQVEVVRENGGKCRKIGRFGPGYHFGEIALLGEEVRMATVRTVQPTQVLELPGKAFQRHLMDIPLARYHVFRVASERRAELLKRPGKNGH
jgi:cyclic nucleotide-binding protein